MTTGTKVFLAVFALFIGALVIYYGMLMPTDGVTPPTVDNAAEGLATGSETVQHEITMGASASPNESSHLNALLKGSNDPLGPLSTDLAMMAANSGSAQEQEAPLFPLVNISSSEQSGDADLIGDGRDAGWSITLPLEQPPTTTSEPGPATQPKLRPPVSSVTKGIVAPGNSDNLAARPQTVEYIIKSGDTMVSIAGQWFGDESKWSLIAKSNPWVDPARMQIGQKLQLPTKDAKSASAHQPIQQPPIAKNGNRSIYTVRAGDTLVKIAREHYGSIAKWKEIYEANRSVIGDDPAALQPGTVLALPKAASRR